MYRETKRLFYFFLWLNISSIAGILFHSFTALMVQDGGKSLFWLTPLVFLVALFPVLFFASKKVNSGLKIVYSLVVTLVLFFLIKYLGVVVMKYTQWKFVDDFVLMIAAGSMFGVIIVLLLLFNNKFSYLLFLAENEEVFDSSEKYHAWLREELGGSTDIGLVKKFVNQITAIAVVLLVLTFLSLSKTPSTKLFHSIFFVLFAVSGLAEYLVYYQLKSIIEWRMMDYALPQLMTRRWNTVIKLFLIPVVLLPLAIPWNFQIFRLDTLNQTINDRLAGVSINVTRDDEVTSGQTNLSVSNQTVTTVETENMETETAPRIRDEFWTPFRVTGYIILTFVVLYVILAIIGAFLYRKYKYSRRGWLVQFLINRYYRLRGILDGIGLVFSLIGRFFAAIFGFHRFNKGDDKDLMHPVEKQLFALFQFDREMDDAKKEEIRTVIKEFVRLIEMTSRLVTPYRFFMGPEEYLDLVIQRMPDLRQVLKQIVSVFNESRYSLHNLSPERIEGFRHSIDYILEKIGER